MSPTAESRRILLMPVEGRMMVNAVVPLLERQVFGLGVPETIGSREVMMLVNHPDVFIEWEADGTDGSVSTTWTQPERLRYSIELRPFDTHVDMRMGIENLSDSVWHDVFAFNCVSPARAPAFEDTTQQRTFLSVEGRPTALADLPRVEGPNPGITIFATEMHPEIPPFAGIFDATSPVASDDSWMAIVSEDGRSYMATWAPDASFLFTNAAYGCIHAAPSFGDIEPGRERVVRTRTRFSAGAMEDLLAQYESFRND